MARMKIRASSICPFYRGEEGQYIFCEGIAPKTTLRLGLGGGAKEYRKACCQKDWKSCRVAKMLDQSDKNS